MKTSKTTRGAARRTTKRIASNALAALLALSVLAGLAPLHAMASGAGDSDPPPISGFAAVEAAYTVTQEKYFMFAEHPDIVPLSDGTLGLGTYGTRHAPMVPTRGGFMFEFVVEQSQEIRLELWTSAPGDPPQAGEKLGLLAAGFCEGQWGDLADRETGEKPGEQ